MTRKMSKKSALFKSAISLLLCFSMLTGTTFAWFTDQVTSAGNIIQSGNLDIDMQWAETYDGDNTVWNDAAGEDAKPVFDYQNWEPGYTEVRYIKVSNEGNLAFKWLMSVIPVGEVGKLAEVIDVRYDVITNNPNFVAPTADNKLGSLATAGTLKNIIDSDAIVVQGVLLPEGAEREGFYAGELVACITLHMQESAGNEYQGEKVGDAFNIQLKAIQYNFEFDSIDADYDLEANFPSVVTDLELKQNISDKVANGKLTEQVVFADQASGITVTLPVGTAVDSNEPVVKIVEDGVDKNITLDQRVGYDVEVLGVAQSNDAVILVSIPKMLPANMNSVQLYHDGNVMQREFNVEDIDADEFVYDKATGDVTFGITHFSNISGGASKSVYVNGVQYDGYEFTLNQFAGITDKVIRLNGSSYKEEADYAEGNYNVVVPNDGNTYILNFDNGDGKYRNELKVSGTWHESYNLNPGDSTDASKQYYTHGIIVEDGATVILRNANTRTDNKTDAIRVGYENAELSAMGTAGVKYFRGNNTKTKILVADGTYNCLVGKSGIGFGYYTGADVYVEGQGALYTAAIRNACPAIGTAEKTDGGATSYAPSGPKVNINVGWMVAIPMPGAAGIGGGFLMNENWSGMSRIAINGGAMQVYAGADATAIGGGKCGNCGEIVINGGKLYLYTNPANTARNTMGVGVYAGSCKGVYVSKDANIYFGTAMSWDKCFADEKVYGFTPLSNITVESDGLGGVTKVVGSFDGVNVELSEYKVVDSNGGKTVIANAVYKDGKVYYVGGAKGEGADILVAQSLTVTGYKETFSKDDSFERGEEFTATLHFSDGSTKDVTDKVTTSGFSASVVGVNTITATYTSGGQSISTTYMTRVIAPVKLTVEPKQSLYNLGEVDESRFKVTVYDSDGTATTLSDFDISYDGDINAPSTNVIVTVSKDGLSASCSILMWNMTKLDGTANEHAMGYMVTNIFNVSGWSNHKAGTIYDSYIGKTYTVPGTGEIVSGFSNTASFDYNDRINTQFGYPYKRDASYFDLTITNASRYTSLGIDCLVGYGDKAVSAYGYYFDDDLSTLKFKSPEYDVAADYQFYMGQFASRVGYLTCDLYSFQPGTTHTVHWVAIFDDGIQTLGDWTVTLKAENNDDAAYEEDPSKPYANVIILAGQSNAAGSAPITDSIRAQYGNKQFSNVFINYINQEAVGNTVTTYFTNGNNFDMYKLGIGGFGANYFGPELGLADYLSTNAPGESWYIIKYAPAGSELDRQWFGDAALADRMISYVKEKINILAQTHNVKVAGLVWMQGESDAADLATGVSGRYSANEQKLVKMVRDELAAYATRDADALGTPGSGIAFINGGISASGFWPEHATVNNAKKANCKWHYDPTQPPETVFQSQTTYNIVNSMFVDTSTLISKNQSYVNGWDDYGNAQDNNDQAHYSDESMLNLGVWFGHGVRSMMTS